MNEVLTDSIQTRESQFPTNSPSSDAVEGQGLPTPVKEPICWTYHFGIIDPKRLHSGNEWGLPSQYSKGPETCDIPNGALQEQQANDLSQVDTLESTQLAAKKSASGGGSVTLGSTWTVLFLVFFVLKVTGTIDWPWIFVFAPVIIQVFLVVVAFVSSGILYVIRNRLWGSAQGDGNYSPL
jgi:hypothetical protein